MEKEAFLKKYRINEQDLEEAQISWEELKLILEDYQKLERKLRRIGKDVVDGYLYDIERAGITSYR